MFKNIFHPFYIGFYTELRRPWCAKCKIYDYLIFNIYSSVWQHHGSFTDRLVSVQSYHTIFAIPVCLLWNYRWRGKSQDLPRTFCPRSTTQTPTVTEFTETKTGNQLYSDHKKTNKTSYSQSRFQNKLENVLFFS